MMPYSDLHVVTQALRWYRIRCIAHRLRKFGFESGVNHLSAEDLLALATMMPEAQAETLRAESVLRGNTPTNERIAP